MTIRRLEQLFNPKRIAVVGVSPNPESVGGRLLRNLIGGFRGVVYPVNPTSEAVLGIPCHPDITSLPKTPDLAVIVAGADQVPDLVRQCGEAGVLCLLIVSAGFREVGPEGRELENRVEEERKKFDGMRILGPNCLGFIVPGLGLNVSFADGMPKRGDIAFISQSGALCSSVLDWALDENIGFSHFVSVGNSLDVDFGDLIDFFGEDERTKSIILYLESVTDARKFMTASRAFARTKPIVAYKAGRFPESAEAAASHTGALASSDDVYDAAFQRAGIARVLSIGDIFDVADMIGREKMPLGPRLAIVTNAGGPGVIATDALIANNGILARLSDESLEALDEVLPPHWSHGNPVDVLGDAKSKRFGKAISIVAKDKGVDAILVIVTPQAMTNPTAIAKAVSRVGEETRKPILAACLGGRSMREAVEHLNTTGVASYATPEQAVQAFTTLVDYARNLDALFETPREIPVRFPLPRSDVRERFDALVEAADGTTLTEDASKQLLADYGIPVALPRPAATADEAVALATELGGPVVLKVHSPDITHKTDVGGVALDLEDEAAVRSGFERVTTSAADARPDARIDGVTVQPMVTAGDSVELILGTRKDPVFGTVIMIGLGGTAAELFEDTAIGFPPLNERLARRMLESLKIWPLLNGYRGRPPMAVEKLLEVLFRFSYLVADFPEIGELDVNPILVTPDAVTALDARVILDEAAVGVDHEPYAHLALRPYPEEYIKETELPDGTKVLLRPIKPEDEPLWFALLRSCSKESLYQRFRYLFHWEAHEVATRFCFNDYDREIAIVAEIEEDGERKLMGVGRLVADPDVEAVEYAVLIGDPWQELGLGGLLTDYCLEISERWGLARVEAQTTTDNPRMIAIFEKRGFRKEVERTGAEVLLVKELTK